MTTSPLLYHSDRLQLVDPLVAFWVVDVQAGEHFTMCMTEENGETSVELCVGVAQGKASHRSVLNGVWGGEQRCWCLAQASTDSLGWVPR